jgi:hypothetical protein
MQFSVALLRRIEDELGVTMTEPTVMPESTRGQVGIIHIRVADADRAVGFFSQLFGWEADPFRGAYTAHYVVNSSILTVLSDDPSLPPVLLFFPVSDVAAAVRRAEELGGRVVSSEITDGGGWARVADDQGMVLGLWRPGDGRRGSPPTREPTGEVGYLTLDMPDTVRGRAFYSEMFGWRFDESGTSDGAHVTNTDLPLGIHRTEAAQGVHLFFRVADLDAAAARVRDLGGHSGEPQVAGAAGSSAECSTDLGDAFTLWQPAPGY